MDGSEKPARALRLGDRRVDLRRGLVLRDGQAPIRLTTREVRLLEYLAERAGRDVPREQLLQEVWGYGPRVVSRTVDTTMQRLRVKVEEDPKQPRFLTTVHGVGYRFLPDEPGEPDEHVEERPEVAGAVGAEAAEHNLGEETDPFIGRDEERRALLELLAAAPGIVTVHGPGGVGKTRLARRAARDLVEGARLPGGAWFVDLTEARDEADVVAAAAEALGIRPGESEPAVATGRLGASLASRGPTLLVLDNAEQVVEATATLARALRDAAPALRLLVTSRETLGLAGERVTAVPPLGEADAVALFVARAARVRPGFGEREADRRAAAELARRLDGLPLALELAAARAGVLGPEAMLERLDHRFRLLAGSRRDLPPRQRTLRGALDWSWDLLTEPERATLAQVSVFRGGFEPGDAEAVVDLGDGPDAPWAIDLLQALKDKSLLQARDGPGVRLGLLDSVREYAAEKLGEGAEAEAARDRHARAVLRRCEALAGRAEGSEAAGARAALRAELDNLRTVAGRTARPEPAVRALLLIDELLGDRLHVRSLRRLADALPAPADPPAAARLVLVRARLARRAGEVDAAERLLLGLDPTDAEVLAETALQRGLVAEARGNRDGAEAALREAVTRYEQAGIVAGACRARASLGYLLRESGRDAEAEEVLRAALAEARGAELRGQEAKLLSTLGLLVGGAGDPRAGRELLQRSLEAHKELGDRRSYGVAGANLAALALQEGRLAEAEQAYAEARRALAEVGEQRFEAVARRNLGVVRMNLGRVDEAEQDFRAALAAHRATGDAWHAGRAASDLGEIALHRGRLEEAEGRYREALGVAEAGGDLRYRAIGLGNLALVAQLRGELDAAEAAFSEALPALAADAGPRAHAYFLAFAGALSAERGRPEEAERRLAEARGALERIGDRKGLSVWSVCRALLDRRRGRTEEAEERLRDLGEGARSLDVGVAMRLLERAV